MLATRTTFRCGRDRRVRRGAARPPVRADGGQALHEARRHRARGFTLLEMLVVLVIAGLLVSLASLSLTRNPRTDLREAQRIALLFGTPATKRRCVPGRSRGSRPRTASVST